MATQCTGQVLPARVGLSCLPRYGPVATDYSSRVDISPSSTSPPTLAYLPSPQLTDLQNQTVIWPLCFLHCCRKGCQQPCHDVKPQFATPEGTSQGRRSTARCRSTCFLFLSFHYSSMPSQPGAEDLQLGSISSQSVYSKKPPTTFEVSTLQPMQVDYQ